MARAHLAAVAIALPFFLAAWRDAALFAVGGAYERPGRKSKQAAPPLRPRRRGSDRRRRTSRRRYPLALAARAAADDKPAATLDRKNLLVYWLLTAASLWCRSTLGFGLLPPLFSIKMATLVYFRRADLPLMNRGDAAAATWIFRGDEHRAVGTSCTSAARAPSSTSRSSLLRAGVETGSRRRRGLRRERFASRDGFRLAATGPTSAPSRRRAPPSSRPQRRSAAASRAATRREHATFARRGRRDATAQTRRAAPRSVPFPPKES